MLSRGPIHVTFMFTTLISNHFIFVIYEKKRSFKQKYNVKDCEYEVVNRIAVKEIKKYVAE